MCGWVVTAGTLTQCPHPGPTTCLPLANMPRLSYFPPVGGLSGLPECSPIGASSPVKGLCARKIGLPWPAILASFSYCLACLRQLKAYPATLLLLAA